MPEDIAAAWSPYGGQAHPVPAAHCPVWLVFLALTSPSILAHWDHSGHCHLHSVLEGPRSGPPGIHRHTTATASHPPRVGSLQHLLSLTWATVGAGGLWFIETTRLLVGSEGGSRMAPESWQGAQGCLLSLSGSLTTWPLARSSQHDPNPHSS